jgi:hypothetical protein
MILSISNRLAITIALVLLLSQAFGFARINFDAVELTLYVNNQHPETSDWNSGKTKDKPLLTLKHALHRSKNIPSRIIVSSGHYRSNFDINTTKLLIIEAENPGQVYISGSDIFKNWHKEDELYFHNWFYKWGMFTDSLVCFAPGSLNDLQRRRELVFINGEPLNQVISKYDLTQNNFFIDEENERIYIKPFIGIDLLKATVEVATRGYEEYDLGRNGSLVRATVHNGQGLVLRGLVFQHTANIAHQDALTISDTENIIIEDCIFQWNNGVGLELEKCSNISVNNIIVRHNGQRGIGLWGGNNVSIKNAQIYGNNWRTNAPRMISHDAAGIKLFERNRNVILDSIKAFNNYCHAIWFDWDNENYIIKNSIIENNQEDGIMLEGSRKAGIVQNCIIRNNNVGIKGYGHANITVKNSLIYSNNHQFRLGQDGRRVVQDDNWEINSENWRIFNNHIIATEENQVLFSFFEYNNPNPPSTRASNEFFKTIQSNNNQYFHPASKKQFPDGKHLTGGQLTFSKWKKRTGQDKNSLWQNILLETDSVNK